MTIWNPEIAVFINGNNLTDVTVENVLITLGRTDITLQPYAGSISLTLSNTQLDNINVSDTVQVYLQATDINYPIYTGTITDLDSTIFASGGSGKIIFTTITATGILSKLAVRVANQEGYALEKDGTRVLNVVKESLGTRWMDLNASLTWATYNPGTWNQVLGVDVSSIDTPGLYDLYPTTAGDVSALGYVQQVAESGFGAIYENTDGSIGYADQDRRADYFAANGAVQLTGDEVLVDGLTVSKSRSTIFNDLTVSYGDPSGTINLVENNSISQYGKITSLVDTFINDYAGASSYATRQILLHSTPEPVLQGVTIALENPNIDDTLRDKLIKTFFGMPVQIDDIPTLMLDQSFIGYIEGWTWNITRYTARLTLSVSDLAYSTDLIAWNEVSVSEAWNTLSGTLTWEQATIGVA
jgi:hypothetical protein